MAFNERGQCLLYSETLIPQNISLVPVEDDVGVEAGPTVEDSARHEPELVGNLCRMISIVT